MAVLTLVSQSAKPPLPMRQTPRPDSTPHPAWAAKLLRVCSSQADQISAPLTGRVATRAELRGTLQPSRSARPPPTEAHGCVSTEELPAGVPHSW